MNINLVIPCSGLGSRFKEAGYKEPKPMIPVGGEPMLQWVLSNFEAIEKDTNLCLIVRKEHNKEYGIEKMVRENFQFAKVNIIEIDYTTEGALCSVMLAEPFFVDGPLICANADQWHFQFSCIDFLLDSQGWDGSIVTFEERLLEDKWSFAETIAGDRVIRVAEKNRISDRATTGIYYFNSAKEFAAFAKDMFKYDWRAGKNNEYYLAPIYNMYIMKDKLIKSYPHSTSYFWPLGTPQDLEKFRKLYLKENV